MQWIVSVSVSQSVLCSFKIFLRCACHLNIFISGVWPGWQLLRFCSISREFLQTWLSRAVQLFTASSDVALVSRRRDWSCPTDWLSASPSLPCSQQRQRPFLLELRLGTCGSFTPDTVSKQSALQSQVRKIREPRYRLVSNAFISTANIYLSFNLINVKIITYIIHHLYAYFHIKF